MKDTPEKCPLGEDLQCFWDIRPFLLTRYANAQFDREGLHSLTPEPHAMDIAERTRGKTVIDACCGVGGNAIAFARTGKQVYAVDINLDRLNMAFHNASLYGVEERITPIEANFVEFAGNGVPSADTLFLDPPWGSGPGDYKKNPLVSLASMSLRGTDLRTIASKLECEQILIKVPSNFDWISLEHISPERIVPYKGLDGRHIFSCVFATKREFVAIP